MNDINRVKRKYVGKNTKAEIEIKKGNRNKERGVKTIDQNCLATIMKQFGGGSKRKY